MAATVPREEGRGAAVSVAVTLRWLGEGLSRLWRRSLDHSHLYRRLHRIWRERFTSRGRFAFLFCILVGIAGVDTRQALVYQIFAFAFGPLAVAAFLVPRRPPSVRLVGALPRRVTAGRPVAVGVGVESDGPRSSGNLVVSWTGSGERLVVQPVDSFTECAPGRPAKVRLQMAASTRGRYVIPGLGVSGTDPLGLLATRRSERQATQTVLAYPRYFVMDDLRLPVGRRYQPGGIPLASSLGDSNEFVGTREYREGDPLRKIHWRSWARRGAPVVKEYHEEYFSRIALVLDTYVPRRSSAVERRAFEAGISVVASIADHFSRTEEVVDIFAAGPDVFRVSAGRSLAYLQDVLDVLACIEPCREPPFDEVGPHLHASLARLTTVVAVVLDWDESRQSFLRGLRDRGVAVRTFLVREGATALPWQTAGRELGEISLLTPSEVERRVGAGPPR
jgi:uncharacterized protein (DUF58 family)